jgi:hypothetical protein
VQHLRDFGRFEMSERDLGFLAPNEKIALYLQKKKFVTKSTSVTSSNHFQLTFNNPKLKITL